MEKIGDSLQTKLLPIVWFYSKYYYLVNTIGTGDLVILSIWGVSFSTLGHFALYIPTNFTVRDMV